MASKKKESEGIMLLSMYNDDEDDDEYEMDDASMEDRGGERAGDLEYGESDMVDGDRLGVEVRRETESVEGARVFGEEDGGGGGVVGVEESGEGDLNGDWWVAEKVECVEVVEERSGGRRTVDKMNIVDYDHDEIAVSPKNEESTFQGEDYAVVHEESQSVIADLQEKLVEETVQVLSPNDPDSPLSSERMKSLPFEAGTLISIESNATEGDDPGRTSGSINPLDKFLPPLPATLCSQELQDKVRKFLKYRKAGKSFNAEVRNRKDYRNPDFLLHAVRYQGIDQVGSCFSKDVFDPHGYDPCDYFDKIEADMKREQERKEQERKKNPQIEFVTAGAQTAAAAALQKVNMSVIGVPTAAGDGLRSADTASRDSRQKKSKWDKVDDDRKILLPPSGKDSLSSVAAHAAILSAANAGAGYTAFVQQRRREAEERRSTDRRPDKPS